MEIELVTTKKKLTKSIIEQLPDLSITNYVAMARCERLGYVRVKFENLGIVKYNDVYYSIYLDWKEINGNHFIAGNKQSIALNDVNKSFAAYTELKNELLLTQIFY